MTFPTEFPTGDNRVSLLVASLNKMKGNVIDTTPARYHFSNDLGVSALIPSIKDQVAKTKPAMKVGLVIGTGGILNFGRELKDIDLWIMIDKNEQLLTNFQDWTDYISKLPNSEAIRKLTLVPEAAGLFDTEMKSYGNYHYAANDQSLEQTKDFLAKKNVAYIAGDITDDSLLTQVSQALQTNNAEVVFANMTNVMEHLKADVDILAKQDSARHLQQLPWNKNCTFLYSTSNNRRTMSELNAKTALGLDEYMGVYQPNPNLVRA